MKTKTSIKSGTLLHHKANVLKPLVIGIAITFTGALPVSTHAATYTVINTNDDGVGSLRRAVQDSNNVTPGVADTIEFSIPAGETIILATELLVTDSVTITGPTAGNASSIILDGGGTNRHVNAGDFATNSGQIITLENISLHNGFFDGTTFGPGYGGGSVFVKNADLVLNHSLISNNSTAGLGANGGGLYVRSGDATLTQSTVSNNSTTGTLARGGGLFVSGDVVLTQSTVTSNSTTGIQAKGGGFYVRYGVATLIQSTVSGNSTAGSSADGGGLFVTSGGDVTLSQSSVVNNSAAAGAGGLSASMTVPSRNVILINSILSGNTGPEGNFYDRASSPVGLLNVNFSLFGDPAAEIMGTDYSYLNPSNNPDLGPLQHNGGLTQTHKPNETSPVLNLGSDAEAMAFSEDQRGNGFPRIHSGRVDIGAVELQNNPTVGDPPLNPYEILTRRDMARELIKAKLGATFTPPHATGTEYADVKIGDINADWIEKFKTELYTEDCAADKFCANSVVSREEIAIPFLKVIGASGPPSGNNFIDVPQGSFSAGAINILRDLGYTTGCDTDKFCPKGPVTREWFNNLLTALP